ncbi:MAG: DegT/DnrJ/EryC1/StrS family aminotransferase [Bacteroidota bacterium]
MSIPFVDLKTQYESIKTDIDQAIASVLDQTAFIGGDLIKDFELSFAEYVGLDHCVGVANGTDAIEIALKALGIGPGDEVIVPALTWISTAGAVNNVGADPVFVDVIEAERTIDPVFIDKKITARTKAMIPVHLYGLPARMNEVLSIAKKHSLKVIEDCSQAHGATIDGKKVGTLGDIATFSFYPGKNLGAYGDAGGIGTKDPDLAKKCRMLSNHGQLKKHHHKIIGRNSRMDTLQAAILKAKLPYLDRWIEGRNQIANWYDQLLEGVIKPMVPGNMHHVFHLYVIQSRRRNQLMQKLSESNISHSIHYPTPLPFLNCYDYKNHKKGDFPTSEKLCSEILSLPIFPEMSKEEVCRVSKVVNNL